jgi:hypothetical protein
MLITIVCIVLITVSDLDAIIQSDTPPVAFRYASAQRRLSNNNHRRVSTARDPLPVPTDGTVVPGGVCSTDADCRGVSTCLTIQ